MYMCSLGNALYIGPYFFVFVLRMSVCTFHFLGFKQKILVRGVEPLTLKFVFDETLCTNSFGLRAP